MKDQVKNIITEISGKIIANGGLKHVYFVACGGSKAAIYPGLYLLQSEAKTFGATTYTSNEFNYATPKELDDRCIAVICSLKATPETVEAVRTANAAGAYAIAMTGSMETGMAEVGKYVVTYSNGDNQVYSESNGSNSLRIGVEILHEFENWEKYDKACEAFEKVDEIIADAKRDVLPAAKAWAEKVKDEPVLYVLASGPNMGAAYSMCICHFMEMQWKHAVCLHTGEYFHGPFETTDKELPMVLFMSEGRTRAMDERCLKFLKTYAENYIVIDIKELNGGKIDADVAEFFNGVIMIPVERYYVAQLAEATGHSLDYRRYMWKVEY